MNLQIPTMQDLLSAGVHFGHKVSRKHPKMKPFIFGSRDGVDIIDLAQSEEKLQEATKAAYEMGKSGKVMLIVGTKKQARDIVKKLADEVETPYLNEHWIGGFLTNFDEIKKNFRKLNSLKDEQEKGTLSRYTKKEQLLISRKLQKFNLTAGGVADLEKTPDVLFIIDAVSDNTAVKEANRIGLEVIGLCDSNADPFWFNYPVPSNDDGIKSIKIICETIIHAYGQGKKEGVSIKEAAKKAEADDAAKKAEEELNGNVAEEAAALEEQIEKKVLEESERKTA